jgi:hypothetical protein
MRLSTTRKHRKRYLGLLLLAAAVLVLTSVQAKATVVIHVSETSGGVFLEGSGTLDLSALTLSSLPVSAFAPWVNAGSGSGAIRVGATGENLTDGYSGSINAGGPFGTGGPFGPNSAPFQSGDNVGTGDMFGPYTGRILVPDGYTFGAPLAGTGTFPGETYASMGITPETYVWSWGTGTTFDSITVVIAIPEPTTSTLALAATFFFVGRRRR